jgi:hypothetical protein
VGSGVSVGEICFAGGEEAVVVAVTTVAAREVHADNATVPSRRLNKTYLLIVETLKRPKAGRSLVITVGCQNLQQ